jgi:hypothetical protein
MQVKMLQQPHSNAVMPVTIMPVFLFISSSPWKFLPVYKEQKGDAS